MATYIPDNKDLGAEQALLDHPVYTAERPVLVRLLNQLHSADSNDELIGLRHGDVTVVSPARRTVELYEVKAGSNEDQRQTKRMEEVVAIELPPNAWRHPRHPRADRRRPSRGASRRGLTPDARRANSPRASLRRCHAYAAGARSHPTSRNARSEKRSLSFVRNVFCWPAERSLGKANVILGGRQNATARLADSWHSPQLMDAV